MAYTWKGMLSNLPAHESVEPTSLLSKCALMSSPRMNLGQYRHFLIREIAKTLFFLNSMIPLRTQKPLSRMTTYPLWNMGVSIRSNNPTVDMSSNCCCPRALRRSLPSTRSIPHMIPEVQQQTIWYSLPNDHGLRGTNMNPGHVNLFVQTLMLSSRQFTYPGIKFSTMLSPQASTICLMSQNLSRYVGGVASVKDKAERMASNRFLLIHIPR